MARKNETRKPDQPAEFGGMTHRLEYDAKQEKQHRKRKIRPEWIVIAAIMLCGMAVLLWLGINGRG